MIEVIREIFRCLAYRVWKDSGQHIIIIIISGWATCVVYVVLLLLLLLLVDESLVWCMLLKVKQQKDKVWFGILTLYKRFISFSLPIKYYMGVMLINYNHYVQING